MTNFDWIRLMKEPEELGHVLCEMIEECEHCPKPEHCYLGCNGFTTWLKEEHKDGT